MAKRKCPDCGNKVEMDTTICWNCRCPKCKRARLLCDNTCDEYNKRHEARLKRMAAVLEKRRQSGLIC